VSIVDLAAELDPAQVGNKFAKLGRIMTLARVPRAICISTESLTESLDASQSSELARIFADLKATVGCFLLDNLREIDQCVAGFQLSERWREELHERMKACFGEFSGLSFAVRSSAVREDTRQSSYAGLYRSILQVRGFDAVCAAVEDVWRSAYGYPALLAKVRAGSYDPSPDMAVIVQEMAETQYAGVAFSMPADAVRIEYVRGTGDALVSGTASPSVYSSGDRLHDGGAAPALANVELKTRELHTVLGYEIDMEWAYGEAGLAVLQVRPVTASLDSQTTPAPLFHTARLYLDEVLPKGFRLGDCALVYEDYVKKRGASYRLAGSMGIATGAAHVVEFNGPGWMEGRDAFETMVSATRHSRVVVDVSTQIRQIISDKADCWQKLTKTLAIMPECRDRQTIIVRDFIRGEYGFISRCLADGSLLVEYSKEGLLSINRGLADCGRIVARRCGAGVSLVEGDPKVVADFRAELVNILRFNEAVNGERTGVQVEWVLHDGVPHFVDFSHDRKTVMDSASDESVVISGGVGAGPILRLEDDVLLSRLSVGPAISVDKTSSVLEHGDIQALVRTVESHRRQPVVFARKPYAILSVLFPHVAAFVFREGGVLCHLAILLREAGIPAVISQSTFERKASEALMVEGSVSLS